MTDISGICTHTDDNSICDECLAELREMYPDQAWFWTKEWQAGEREADEDIRLGRYTEYATIEEFIASLDRKE